MAVTVTYKVPAGTVAPTAQQAFGHSRLVATVIATADADTTITITHNWGLTAAELAAGQPDVSIALLTAAGVLSAPTVTTYGTNTVVLTKSTAVGSGAAPAQIQVVLTRPFSTTL